MAVQKKVNFVTIGAGWTAAIYAQVLTEAGFTVVSLEQGPERWANPDFQHNHDPLRYHKRTAMMVDLTKETWSWRPNPNSPSLPIRQYGSFNPGQGVGGSAIHWSGMLWRHLQTDFNYRTHYIQKYGANKLPEGNTIQDWPWNYDELEPFYTKMEYDIGASGKAGNLNGVIQEGGNPFEESRSVPYPLPPLNVTIPSRMYADACKKLGYHPFPQPAGILSQAYVDRFGNVRSGCLYCGYCTRYGCEVDAKSEPINTHIPPALATGLYEIRPNSKVVNINVDSSGLATGVTYIDQNGQEQEQPADVVLVTGFTLTNNRLLLISRSKAHPDGVGNDKNRVGKNYTYQHWHDVSLGKFPGRRFNLYMGNTSTQNVIFDFQADVFDHSHLDFVGGAMLFSTLGERDPNTSADTLPLKGSKKKGWGQDWKDELTHYWDSVATITMQGESLAYVDQFLDLDPVYKAADGYPLLRITFDWHQNDYNMYKYVVSKADEIMKTMGPSEMHTAKELTAYNIHQYQSTHPTGGTIMGVDPSNSVTNKYGQVWDTPNVFVTGASLFPQNPGVNPTGTVLAMAYASAEAIRDTYMKSPNKLIA